MLRHYIDCRDIPSAMHCTVAVSADAEDELLEAAVQHAVSVHHHQDSPELRQQLRKSFKVGSPSPRSWNEEGTPAYLKQELEEDDE